MSDAKSPPDLSMDEILTTIRRIIAEDEQSSIPTSVASTTAREAGSAPAIAGSKKTDAAADEVLELTDALNEDGSVRRLAPIGASSRPPSEMIDPLPDARNEPEPAAEARPELPRIEPESPPSSEPTAQSDDRLLSDAGAVAVAGAFARLKTAPRIEKEPPLIGDRPLDEVVRDQLTPMLRTWLDENLPQIVERLVEAEIARLARRSSSG
jgi:cell pole-organizing protein PopZ